MEKTHARIFALIAFAAAAAPSAWADSITSFTLYNADNFTPISGYNPIASGATIDLSKLPTRNLSIHANTSPSTVGSVAMVLDGSSHTESGIPYQLCGGTATSDTPCPSLNALGSHTLKATPYTGSNLSGTAGTSLQISFTISDSSASTSRNAFSAIQAESYDSASGVAVSGSYVGYVDAGDSILYRSVNFGTGAALVAVTLPWIRLTRARTSSSTWTA